MLRTKQWTFDNKINISSSLIVELGFEQKFEFDPRVDVLQGWTHERFQFNPRVDVRRVLSSLFELTIYGKMKKISLSAEFSVERYTIIIKSSHHDRFYQVVSSWSFLSSRLIMIVFIKSFHHDRLYQVVLSWRSYQATLSSHPTKPTYQAHLSSSSIKFIYQAHLSSSPIKLIYQAIVANDRSKRT